MKKFLNFILDFFSCIIFFISKIEKRFFNKIIDVILLRSIQRDCVRDFYSVKLWPKNPTHSKLFDTNSRCDNHSILMQGNYVRDNDFTFETIKLYRKNFPGVSLILSTWEGLTNQEKKELEGLNCCVVCSEIPSVKGYTNFNLQLQSVIAGLVKAKEINNKFILKTRTDQRMYEANSLMFLEELWNTYPSSNDCSLEGRIIVLGNSTYRNIPFHIGDMLQFAALRDFEFLWDVDFQSFTFTRENHLETIANNLSVKQFLELDKNTPETHLGMSLWKKVYSRDPLNGDLRLNHNMMLRDIFCFVDAAQLQLLWPKYSTMDRQSSLSQTNLKSTITYIDWFLFYTERLNELCLSNPDDLMI
jgi:hypothetical protein